jgi:formate dehydrogenase
MVSKWSFLQVPNPRKHMDAIRERGGRVIIIDPRRTETAKAAGEHHFIKPGTDVWFYLSFLHVLVESGGVRTDVVERYMTGLDEALGLCKDWSPERAGAITGIAAPVLRDLVKTYLAAEGACLYSSTGVNMNQGGTLAFYLQEVINAVSGNLDHTGGTLVGRGIFDFPKFGRKYGVLLKQDRSRIGNFRKTNDAFPGGILADEILNEGPGRIRALIVTGGNPLITMADSDRLRRAFGKLELLVCLDILPTETASAGHWMLPCTSPLERPDLPFIFPLALGMQTRPYLQATRALLQAPGEARDEATIYTELAKVAHAPLFGSRFLQFLIERSFKKRGADRYRSIAQEGLLNLLLKLSGLGRFSDWLGHGKLRPGNAGGTFLGRRVYHQVDGTGRVDLAPADLVAAVRALAPPPADDAFAYRLITRRHIQTHNSWTHNDTEFLQRLGGRNHLYMHSTDARRENFAAGALVDVVSAAGAIRLPVSVCDDLLPGVVAVPHGWGHQASGNTIARTSPGVNVNILARSGPAAIDPLSGMSQMTAIPVRLSLAADDVTSDWSGINAPEAISAG